MLVAAEAVHMLAVVQVGMEGLAAAVKVAAIRRELEQTMVPMAQPILVAVAVRAVEAGKVQLM